jgi:P27 family predicted phage terminase small subunit
MAGQGRSPSAVALPVQGTLATLPPPKGLPAAAADTWRAILSDMAALRTLREVDMPLVLAYCEAVYVHTEASANIHTYGVLVKGPRGPIPNPMIRVQKDAATTIRQLSDVLGLNPLARIRGNLMEVAGQSVALGIRDRLLERLGD